MARAKRTSRPARSGNKTANEVRKGDPRCSFCGKSYQEVTKLVGGPGVYICDACVGLCNDILADEATEAAWTGWESMTDEDLLASLGGNLGSVEHVREGLQAKVDELRRREVSWARIGESLSMSRQAAWERFS